MLNSTFDRIYVITIERSDLRRKAMVEGLAGLEFRIFPGVDGRSLSADELSQVYDDSAARTLFGRSLSPGEIGCALSHRAVYEEMVKDRLQSVLVIEDDVILHHDKVDNIRAVMAELPSDWDLLYLGINRPDATKWLDLKRGLIYPILHHLRIRRYPLAEIRTAFSSPFSRHLRRAGRHNGAWAYAVSLNTAEHLIGMQNPVQTVSDGALWTFCGRTDTKCFIVRENIFSHRQDVGGSLIWD